MNAHDEGWRKAVANAPDVYEVHSIIKRIMVGPQGREVPREVIIGRRIVADGETLYEQST